MGMNSHPGAGHGAGHPVRHRPEPRPAASGIVGGPDRRPDDHRVWHLGPGAASCSPSSVGCRDRGGGGHGCTACCSTASRASEMSVTTYVGFSIVSLMCIAWLVLPFHVAQAALAAWHAACATRIGLDGANFKPYPGRSSCPSSIGDFTVPTGLILFMAAVLLPGVAVHAAPRRAWPCRRWATTRALPRPRASTSTGCASSAQCFPRCWAR